jgi:hypothetical protein
MTQPSFNKEDLSEKEPSTQAMTSCVWSVTTNIFGVFVAKKVFCTDMECCCCRCKIFSLSASYKVLDEFSHYLKCLCKTLSDITLKLHMYTYGHMCMHMCMHSRMSILYIRSPWTDTHRRWKLLPVNVLHHTPTCGHEMSNKHKVHKTVQNCIRVEEKKN